MIKLNALRVRFALWTAALLLAVLSAFGIYIYQSMARRLASAVDESLTLVAAQVAVGLDVVNDRLVFAESFDQEPENLDLRRRGYTVWMLRPGGRLVHAFGPYQDMALTGSDTLASVDFATVIEPRSGDALRVHAIPVPGESGPVAVVQVARSLEETRDTLGRLATTLLIGIPGLVLTAGLGGYLLATRALAPIDRITETARRISAEDLSARLTLPAVDDEVSRLASTLNEMLARLEASFRRERQFTADASHELRTPLSAMAAILDHLRSQRRTPAEYEQALGDMAEQADRLQALTADLLRLARGETRENSPSEVVDLSALVTDLCDSYRPAALGKGLRLACGMPHGLTTVGDRDALIRLFGNLLDNAIKYTEHGGIQVSAEEGPVGTLRLYVTDTGSGIAPEHLPHVFDRFYRADPSRASQGAGLGLAIAQELAHNHGGQVAVSSRPGEGSTFTVTLPMSSSLHASAREPVQSAVDASRDSPIPTG
jgi:heavy metal sensor kinase